MTRFIAADELIGGLPAPQVRLALRRLGSGTFDAEALARSLRPAQSTAQGRALLSALAADGLVERHDAGWVLSRPGIALANASARKPMTRATAESVLGAFLGRVREARDDEDRWPHRPEQVYLFGSLLTTDKTLVGDVDLVVVLAGRSPSPDAQQAADQAYVAREEAAGRRFGFLDRLYAPTEDLRRFLRGRSPGLSLATERTLADLAGERFELLYEHPSFTPAGAAWLARTEPAAAARRRPAAARPVAAGRPFDPLLPRRRGRPWVTHAAAAALRDALRACVTQADAAIAARRVRLERGDESRDWARARAAALDAEAAIRADPRSADDPGWAAAEHVDLLLRAAMLVGAALGRHAGALLCPPSGGDDAAPAFGQLRSALGAIYLGGLAQRNAELFDD